MRYATSSGIIIRPRKEETVNFKAIYDADLIVNLEEEQKNGQGDKQRIESIVNKAALTESGRELAKKVLLA